MGHNWLQHVSGAVLGVMLVFPAAAQTSTETYSSGDRYENMDTYSYGAGSSTQTLNIFATIGTQELIVSSQSRYFQSYSLDEIQQAVPPGYDYDLDGATVSIVSWTAPEFRDSSYEIIDTFNDATPYLDIVPITSFQFTSGDGPDTLIPTGYRGFCYDDGVTGATNFGGMEGQYANCDYGDNVTVAPGTVNTNTHTTTLYVAGFHYFQSVDDAYTASYSIRPLTTATTSFGTVDTVSASASTVRIEAEAVRFTGTLGGETILTRTVAGRFADAPAQAALADLLRPTTYALGGRPVVLTWSEPVHVGADRALVSTTTDTLQNVRSHVDVSTTTTYGGIAGGVVYIGDRGSCSDSGVSGATNGGSPTGAAANCVGGVGYGLGFGETSTNTHTSLVTDTETETITTENWLTTDKWQLAATPTAVGGAHAATRDALYRGGGEFGRLHIDSLDASKRRVELWARGKTGTDRIAGNAAGPSSRTTVNGLSGGASIMLSDLARVGVAIGYDAFRTHLTGTSEGVDIALTQVGAAVELSPANWRVRAAVSHGWGDIETMRGNAGLGGQSRADYGASTWSASVDAGPAFDLGSVSLRPLAAVDWTRATLDGFTESGGLALTGARESRSRTAVTLGVEGAIDTDLGSGTSLRVWADGRAGRVVDGRERERGVAFASTPTTLLRATSARERARFGEVRGGIAVITAGGFGMHLSAETRIGEPRGWRASAGISAAF